MELTPTQKAVSLALQGKWEEALKINLEIIKDNPSDIDALNRAARAYSELGEVAKAKSYAQKVVAIDPVNPIAVRALEKWQRVNKKVIAKSETKPEPKVEAFLEESGRTKIVDLLNLGKSDAFANLDPGEEVILQGHSHKVSISTTDGDYLGRLPDDISARLRSLVKLGNKYQVLIKSISPKKITVFIREIKRGPKAQSVSSFPTERLEYVAFTPPELIHKDSPEVSIPEDLGDD